MKKGTPKKNVTIDELAVMVANGFEKVDNRFDSLENRFDTFENKTKKNFEEVEANFVKVRRDILEMSDKYVSKHDFDKLTIRVINLESKKK